jgi:hypothetical protein
MPIDTLAMEGHCEVLSERTHRLASVSVRIPRLAQGKRRPPLLPDLERRYCQAIRAP